MATSETRVSYDLKGEDVQYAPTFRLVGESYAHDLPKEERANFSTEIKSEDAERVLIHFGRVGLNSASVTELAKVGYETQRQIEARLGSFGLRTVATRSRSAIYVKYVD